MKRLLVVTALLLAACGSGSEPVTTGSVTGTVTAVPCYPVERQGGPPCRPVPGVTVVIGQARVVTDSTGTYKVLLPPGTYNVSVIAGARQVPASPAQVTVERDVAKTVNLTYDSGIR